MQYFGKTPICSCFLMGLAATERRRVVAAVHDEKWPYLQQQSVRNCSPNNFNKRCLSKQTFGAMKQILIQLYDMINSGSLLTHTSETTKKSVSLHYAELEQLIWTQATKDYQFGKHGMNQLFKQIFAAMLKLVKGCNNTKPEMDSSEFINCQSLW